MSFFQQISRGSANAKYQTTTNLINHLRKQHPGTKLEENSSSTPTESTSGVGQLGHKRKSTFNVFKIRNKEQRTELYQNTIPDWVEAKTMMKMKSDRAQKLHKTLFERLVLDLVPFSEVNNPGFLRYQAVIAPNFEVGSDKYYRYALVGIVNKLSLEKLIYVAGIFI